MHLFRETLVSNLKSNRGTNSCSGKGIKNSGSSCSSYSKSGLGAQQVLQTVCPDQSLCIKQIQLRSVRAKSKLRQPPGLSYKAPANQNSHFCVRMGLNSSSAVPAQIRSRGTEPPHLRRRLALAAARDGTVPHLDTTSSCPLLPWARRFVDPI